MFGVAIIGWIIAIVMLVQSGSLEFLSNSLALGGTITLGSIVSWGFSALSAISYERQRMHSREAEKASARRISSGPRNSGPWDQSKARHRAM
jgi:hypothetical protein